MAVQIVLVRGGGLSATVLTDTRLGAVAAMLESWINADVAPAWNQGKYLVTFVKDKHTAPQPTDHVWLFSLEDATDVPGAGGYHSVDAHGNPYCKVFVGDALREGWAWTVALTHEAAEAMVNRFAYSCVLASYGVSGGAYFMEACDPFEAGPSYRFEGFDVANFALPAYFKPWASGPYDKLGLGRSPLLPIPGGRQTVLPLSGVTITLDDKLNPSLADKDHVPPPLRIARVDTHRRP